MPITSFKIKISKPEFGHIIQMKLHYLSINQTGRACKPESSNDVHSHPIIHLTRVKNSKPLQTQLPTYNLK